MKNYTKLIIITLGLVSSCERAVKPIDGWWLISPVDSTTTYYPLWSTQDSTLLYFEKGILEVPKGIDTPSRFYGNQLPYYVKNQHLFIFSPIEYRWIAYKVTGDGEQYKVHSDKGISFNMTRTMPFDNYDYPSIKRIELTIMGDSLSLESSQGKIFCLFDFKSDLTKICTTFYDKNCTMCQSSKLENIAKEYFTTQLSRLSKSIPKQYSQKVSDVSRIKLLIDFIDGTSITFTIGDPFYLPAPLKNLVHSISNYRRLVPMDPTCSRIGGGNYGLNIGREANSAYPPTRPTLASVGRANVKCHQNTQIEYDKHHKTKTA